MTHLVMLADGRFAVDAKARKFTREFPCAHQFDDAREARHVAGMLNLAADLFSRPGYEERKPVRAHAVSVDDYDVGRLPFSVHGIQEVAHS